MNDRSLYRTFQTDESQERLSKIQEQSKDEEPSVLEATTSTYTSSKTINGLIGVLMIANCQRAMLLNMKTVRHHFASILSILVL